MIRPIGRPVGKPATSGGLTNDPNNTFAVALRNLWAFITRDTQAKITSAVVAGAIIGAILPGVSWVIGGLVGGFIAYRITDRKK